MTTQKQILERLEYLHKVTTLSLQLSDPGQYNKNLKEINRLSAKL